jgi:hypothetical protein
MSARLLGLAVISISFLIQSADAAPVQWPVAQGGNGHWYAFVAGTEPWTQAKTDAEALSFNGLPGHLTTITSQAESDFIFANFSPVQAWLGGYQDHTAPDYSEPAGGWRWVTGETWSYTNWATQFGFPDNFGTIGQDYLKYASGPYWDDLENNARAGSTGVDGFLVEFQAVPEPGSAALLGIVACAMPVRRPARARTSR